MLPADMRHPLSYEPHPPDPDRRRRFVTRVWLTVYLAAILLAAVIACCLGVPRF